LVLCQLGHAATALKQPEVLGYYAEALQIATAEQIDRIAVEVLTGVAQQMIQNHNHDLAVALLSLVQNHTASEFETKRKAHGLLIELEAQLPAHQVVEGRQRGQALALQDIVSNLFNGYLFTSIERPNEPSPPPDKVPINLTDREVEVLRLVAQGNTDQQIAKRLQVSVRTVNSHVTNILRKTGSNNRTAAAVFARDIGLV
jgi:DNA-binding NarL/FixJ family response regulator